MKFCKDCKHCAPHSVTGLKQAQCARTAVPVPDYRVMGTGPQFTMSFCSTERIGKTSEKNCGEDAGFFEEAFADVPQ